MYIGVQPTDTYLSIASQQITGNGGATYTLDYSVSDEESVAVFVNNVRQNVSTYTVSGTSLTLGGTISASDSCWVLFLGRTVGTKTPAVGSVTNDMLAGSIATSKLADGSTFATTNGITMVDTWRVTSNFTSSTGTNDITSNWERSDDSTQGFIGTGMTESSGIFTFPQTGIYLVLAQIYAVQQGGASQEVGSILKTTTDNSSYNTVSQLYTHLENVSPQHSSVSNSYIMDVTDTTTHKIKFAYETQGSFLFGGGTDIDRTCIRFIRLGDT